MKRMAVLFLVAWIAIAVGMVVWPQCGAKDDFAPFAGLAMGASLLGLWWSLGEVHRSRKEGSSA